jgi:outer membrane protein assembly factor BamB
VRVGEESQAQWQVVVNGTGSRDGSNGFVSAYDLWDGSPQWQVRGTADMICPTAIIGEGLIVTASGVSGPMLAIELASVGELSTPPIRWQHHSSGPSAPTGLIYGNRLFAVTSDGLLSCLALDDGRTLWREELGGPVNASLVAGAGHVYATTESGDVYVVRASDNFELIGTNAMHELCLATPAIADSQIFIRTESRLFCISEELSRDDSAEEPDVATTQITDAVVSPSDLPIE